MKRLSRLLIALAFGVACSQAEPAQDPAPATQLTSPDEDPRLDVVLVVICSLRRQHLGLAGYPRPTSPYIDSLAASGVSFEHAMGAASWTKPATASILSGLTPNVHGMTDYYKAPEIRGTGFSPKRVLADEIVTIPEVLAAAGYATMGRNNNIHAGAAFNMDQGFENTKDLASDYDTPKMLRDFDRWLGGLEPGQPFFFFLLTRDVHVTYKPLYEVYRRFARAPVIPEAGFTEYAKELHPRIKALDEAGEEIPEELKRQWIDLYDAELAGLDEALSELSVILEHHGRAERTVVILTADHGERLFDPHGAISHGGGFLEQHLVHIPLIMRGAGIPEGVQIDPVVRSIDILPTLAALAETEPPDVVQGRSLLPLLRGEETRSAVSGFATHMENEHAVRMGRHKLHHDPDGTIALYDVEADPEETSERSADDPDRTLAMRSELERWLEQERALRGLVAAGEVRELAPEVIDGLRELGYVE